MLLRASLQPKKLLYDKKKKRICHFLTSSRHFHVSRVRKNVKFTQVKAEIHNWNTSFCWGQTLNKNKGTNLCNDLIAASYTTLHYTELNVL